MPEHTHSVYKRLDADMNPRIKQLAEQANGFFHLRWDGREGSVEFQADNLEKFAELIVRECASKVTRNEALNILEHFGVEE